MKIDTHCHTDCSDGNITIEERIDLIKKCGYDAATITDHDYVSNEQVERAKLACGEIPFIPGIELSLCYENQTVHMLGFFIKPDNEILQNHIAAAQEKDLEITCKLIDYFEKKFNYHITIEQLKSNSLNTFYSMMFIKNIARNLFNNDARTVMDAFLAGMKWFGLSYADFSPWNVRDVIEIIHTSGGLAVLAHPGGEEDGGMRNLGFLVHKDEHIRKFVEYGLDGIEVSNPVHSIEEKKYYNLLANKYKLLPTAGSDCHGDDPYLGPALMGTTEDIYENSYEVLCDFYTKRVQGSNL